MDESARHPCCLSGEEPQPRAEPQMTIRSTFRDILDRKTGPGQLVFAGADISGIRWLGDGEHLSMLIPEHGSRTAG